MSHNQQRKLSNWLDAYLEYTENTESAIVYKKWVAISVMASTIRRQVYMYNGQYINYPNFFIVLVGPPGTGKSEAIKTGYKLTRHLDDIKVTADAVTRELLISDLELSKLDVLLETGEAYKHCSMTSICSELEVFLGSKKDNGKLVSLLTTLWDCPDVWQYRTKGSGKNLLENVWFHLIGATTPASLAASLPDTAHGTGFTARIVFAYAKTKAKKVATPFLTDEQIKLGKLLEDDLYLMSLAHGEIKMTPDGLALAEEWYNSPYAERATRICQSPSFDGWYERKQTFLYKTCMVLAMSESNDMLIKPHHVEKALDILSETELSMSQALGSFGRNEMAGDIEDIRELVRARKQVTEEEIMAKTWNNLTYSRLKEALDTLCKTGMVRREYPNNNILYVWNGDKKR